MDSTILYPSALGSAITGASVGLLSHWTYFIHGEHHRGAAKLAAVAAIFPVSVYALQHILLKADFATLLKSTAIIVFAFWASLWTSIIVYRVFFHRLRAFPGPKMAAVSKGQHLLVTSKKNNYKYLTEVHEKYGPFVRTGPNEVSILHPAGLQAISGPTSKCNKSPWYDIGLPMVSLHTCRDRTAHGKRRRMWDQGFSAKALRDFEPRELALTRLLAFQFSKRAGQPVNVSHWFNFYSFDVMGELAFGQSFDMVKTGEKHEAMDMLHKAMLPYSCMATMPWLLTILSCIPGAGKEFDTFVRWCAELVEKRKTMTPDNPDLMTFLIENKSSYHFDYEWLKGDARLVVVAGSDTTSASLVHIFYNLAKRPDIVKQLREELKTLVPSLDEFAAKDVADAPLLNGVINESLRLHPPVPSGSLRVTPPEGITVDGTFIPGGVTVTAPFHALGRLESCFERPNEFIPERWSTQPSLVRDASAFHPFSMGKFSCIGKNLALMELRSVIALLVLQFDIRFADGEDGSDLINKSIDTFTITLGKLDLVFDAVKP